MCKLLNGKSFLFAALLLSAISMSCSHDPHDENQDPSNTDVHEWEDSTLSGDAVMGSAMTFKVGGGMSVERTAQTRATTDINGIATFTEGDFVAVAVTRSGGSEVIKLYQVKSDGSLEYAGGDNDPFVWKSTTEQVTIRAWSYGTSTNLSYTLTAPETRDYTLETDQQTNGYRELLYCKAANKSYSSGAISLNFYHQLARMVFNVAHERTGTLAVTSYSLGNTTSFPIKASFTVPTGDSNVGTWTTRTTYGTITPKVEDTQSGYEKTYSAVIFPRTYDQNTKFFTITNNEGDYVFNISESGGFTPTVGNQYNYTINVKNRPKLPIEFVADYNLASTSSMATSHNPNASMYICLGTMVGGVPTPSTTFTGLINGVSISGKRYHMPSAQEWLSILPPDHAGAQPRNWYDIEWVDGTDGLRISYVGNNETRTGLGETMQWGRKSDGTYYMPSTKFYNEYASNTSYTSTRTEGGISVTRKYGYAIRLKARDIAGPSGYGECTCAYRYTYTNADAACNNLPSLRVKVRYLGKASTTTLADICNEAYWSDANAEYFEIILEACGYNGGGESNVVYPPGHYSTSAGYKSGGLYWSSTCSGLQGGSAGAGGYYFAYFREDYIGSNELTGRVGDIFPVRLFADYQ